MNKTLTEHFAEGARAAIERRREQLIAAHASDLTALDADLAAIAEHERFAVAIAARYLTAPEIPPAVVPPTPPLASKPKRVSRGGKPPYTPAEDARIMETGRTPGQNRPKFEELARTMPGRTWLGLERHYQELKAARTPTKATPNPKAAALRRGTHLHLGPQPGEVETTTTPSSPLGSEISQIVEATSVAEDVADAPDPMDEIDAQRRFDPEYVPGKDDLVHYPWRPSEVRKLGAAVPQPTSRLRAAPAPNSPKSTGPVRDVSGPLMDGGPGNKRVYDYPEAFRSKNSD